MTFTLLCTFDWVFRSLTQLSSPKGWMWPPKEEADLSGHRPSDATVDQILKMEPKVECSADSMKLQVQNSAATQGSLFLIDRGK